MIHEKVHLWHFEWLKQLIDYQNNCRLIFFQSTNDTLFKNSIFSVKQWAKHNRACPVVNHMHTIHLYEDIRRFIDLKCIQALKFTAEDHRLTTKRILLGCFDRGDKLSVTLSSILTQLVYISLNYCVFACNYSAVTPLLRPLASQWISSIHKEINM